MKYPPYVITSTALKLTAAITDALARLDIASSLTAQLSPRLRRENRIRTIHASLAIENNTLSLEQVTAIMDGKAVLGPPRDIQEVRGAIAAYERLGKWQPHRLKDMLDAHNILMYGLVSQCWKFRSGWVGVFQGNRVVHMAPPADLVHEHMCRLLDWLHKTDEHPLIASCVFHYEFEFIHPFADGNGRMGRLWQTLILSKWKSFFAYIPVESIIRTRQDDYYASLATSDAQGEATAFVEFMLQALLDALKELQSDQVTDQVSDQVRLLLTALADGPKSVKALMHELALRHAPTFRKNYLRPALEGSLVVMTNPDSPHSPLQKYILTEKARRLLKS